MPKNYLTGALFIVIGLAIIFLVFYLFQSSTTGDKKFISNVNTNLNGVSIIEIETDVTAITISESEDNQFYAVLEQPSNKHTITLPKTPNNMFKLVVEHQRSPFSFISFGSLNTKLDIKIPKDFIGALKVESDTGKININGTNIAVLEAETDTGGITVNNLNSDDISVETTTAAIRLKHIIVDTLKAQSKTASIHLDDVQTNSLNAKTTTGSIHVDGDIKAFDIKSTTGSIHLSQVDIKDDSKLVSTTGSIHVTLSDMPQSLYVSYDTSVGNYKLNKTGYNVIQNSKNSIEFQYGSGDIKLDVETTTGSFNFN